MKQLDKEKTTKQYICVKNLCKRYGEKTVFDHLQLQFPVGSCTVLMGESGIGKTTLLRILMGLETADRGEIFLFEPDRISAVFQEDRLCDDFSAVENCRLVTRDTERIREALAAVGLGQTPDLPVREFSRGMKRRVALVRAVLADADVLFMDEPFEGLDEENRQRIIEYVRRETRGKTVILVTHNPGDLVLADQVINLSGDNTHTYDE